jgi:hypothetical protein
MKCNVGKTDRLIRIIVGSLIVAIGYAYWAIAGYYCVWANLGFIPLLTGLFRYCPLYVPLKIDTGKSDPKKAEPGA